MAGIFLCLFLCTPHSLCNCGKIVSPSSRRSRLSWRKLIAISKVSFHLGMLKKILILNCIGPRWLTLSIGSLYIFISHEMPYKDIAKTVRSKRYSKQSLMSNLLVCCLPNVFCYHLCVKHLCFHAHWLSKLTGILLHLFLLSFVAWSFNTYLTVLFSVWGWSFDRYLVRTLDNGECVRLQYRSLQKSGGETLPQFSWLRWLNWGLVAH